MGSKRPIFGSASLAMPVLVFLLTIGGIALSNSFTLDLPGWAFFVLYFVALIAGVVVGITGFIRHERHRWLSILGIAVNSIFILSELLPPSLFFGGLDRNVYALVSQSGGGKYQLPEVSVSLDGFTATFRKGTAAFDEFIGLLRMKRSDEELLALGERPSISTKSYCGAVIVPYDGLRFHFKLYRSTSNPNYMWIGLPHRNRGGTAILPIIDDGRVLRLVQKTAEQQHEAH